MERNTTIRSYAFNYTVSSLTFSSVFAQLFGALIAFGGCIFPLLVLRHKLLKSERRIRQSFSSLADVSLLRHTAATSPVPASSTWLRLLQSIFTQSRSLRLIVWHGIWGFLWSLIYCGVVEARYGEGRSVDLALSRPTS
jgi:uncharacterized membrane protein YciS (DUF1049 family)